MTKTAERAQSEESLRALLKGVPLGVDEGGGLVLAQTREKPFTVRHICVTGADRTAFIKRLLLTLSCLYEKTEASVLVLSPRLAYGELLALRSADINLPFVNKKEDIAPVKNCVCELLELRARERGCPRLVVVLDGLEELENCNEKGDLEEYRTFFELLARREDVDVITGVDLMKSIFSGYPGAFVGVGNCLVTTHSDGKADVTYVSDDSSLSKPTAIVYPDEPSVAETVLLLNAMPER